MGLNLRCRLQLHIGEACVFDLIKLFLDFLAGGLGAEAHYYDGREAQHKAGDEFVNLEDLCGESGKVELPHEGGDAAYQHTRDGTG